MNFCREFHVPQKMNSDDFGDPLIFLLLSRGSQRFLLSCEISQHPLDGLAQDFVQSFLVPKPCILGVPLSFPLPSGD